MSRRGIKNTNALHKWTPEELAFVQNTYQEYDINQTLILLNERFKLAITKSQLKGILNLYKIKCGRKSHPAHNKGKKWREYLSKEAQDKIRKTTFKKGHLPTNTVPVGTEGEFKGYIVVKTEKQEGQKSREYWRLKHHLIWEAVNGDIPKGYNVIFADGNARNFELDNLVLVSDKELALMNTQKLYFKDNADATKSGALIAKIHYKQKELLKCRETH